MHGLFGEIQISEEAHQRGQNPARFRPVKGLNGLAELFGHRRQHLRQASKRNGSIQLRSGFSYPQFIGVRVVTGLNPAHERVLVLWRKTKDVDSDALDAWFWKQGYNTKDQEFDVIYVNGDNNLENLRQGEQTWKVRLIEEEFRRLMFDVEDI